ncbi:MAG TPA: PfkB family carbohydrate kinase [Pseudonocardiaceae bacterium]|nr:PfkB family carbohydrate kinase [Pseudonocardiaceae bacterium]
MTAPVIVVGGTYHEYCVEPESRNLAGSGMRAAALLVSLDHPVTLRTYIDQATAGEAHAVARGTGVTLVAEQRRTPIRFTYVTPLAHPTVTGSGDEPALEIDGDLVVSFGLFEGRSSIRATRLVVDPQHHRLVDCGLAAGHAGHLAVVLNAREARHLTGAVLSADSGRALITETGAEVVVVKNGIRGATVITSGSVEHVGAHPTRHVWPIGSGDAFTAGFASAWSRYPDDPVRAAHDASRVAAAYCTTGTIRITPGTLESIADALPDREVTVYLAGPFFTLAQRWLINHVRDALQELGVLVFSPLHDVGIGGDEVAESDLTGLDQCDGVLALLDNSDPGTLFETGFATRTNLPVVSYAEHPEDHAWTMLRGTGAEIHADLSTAIYRAGWRAIAAGDPGS